MYYLENTVLITRHILDFAQWFPER